MFAKSLISKTITAIGSKATVNEVLKKMQKLELSELPLTKAENLIGLISKSELYKVKDKNMPIAKCSLKPNKIFVKTNQFFLDAIFSVSKFNVSIIPVLDNNEHYAGAITARDLLDFFVKFAGIDEYGAVIILEININDYMLTEISQIVENNDAKILNLYVYNAANSSTLDVVLKLNTHNISSIISTFERYEYKIKYKSAENELLDNFYNERLHEFMNYLNV